MPPEPTVDAAIGARRLPWPIPIGWFSVGRLRDLPAFTGDAGAVHAFRAVGQELVAWFDGESHRVADAFCPHLGAHLGVGGRVSDGCLVCPFHEWSFDGDGLNVRIPYADRPNAKARLRTYPTDVRDGHLRFWYHPDHTEPPSWNVPTLVDDSWVHCGAAEWTVASAWQEMAENSIDMAHFVSIHGMAEMGRVGDVDEAGAIRKVVNVTTYSTSKGSVDGQLKVEMYGPGTSLTVFEMFGTVSLLSTTTPIDDATCTVRMDFFHGGDDVSASVAEPFAAEVKRQFEQDVPIWENKRFVASPALAPSEKPITEFRRWASQFYV